jgi:hypothetical protein
MYPVIFLKTKTTSMRPEGQKIVMYIGTAIGILGGLLGMAVAIAAAPLYGSLFSLFFIVVFGWVFGGLYLRGRKQKKLLAMGTRANGRIVEMYDTGVTVNNQPQVGLKIEVTPVSGPPFTSEIKLVISRLQTAYYQVGMNCIVRYDPNDKKTVAIESLGDSLGGSSNSSQNFGSYVDQYSAPPAQSSPYFPGKTPAQIEEELAKMGQEETRIRQIGTECKAVIKTCNWTNIYANGDNPLNFFELVVMPDNQPAYDASCFALISAASVQKYQAGKQIWVKYDPADKNKISLSHS